MLNQVLTFFLWLYVFLRVCVCAVHARTQRFVYDYSTGRNRKINAKGEINLPTTGTVLSERSHAAVRALCQIHK